MVAKQLNTGDTRALNTYVKLMRATESIDRYLNLFRLRLKQLAAARGIGTLRIARSERSLI